MTPIQSNTKNKCQSTQNGEAGFTMIELVIVLVLTSILGIFVFQIVTGSLNTLITMRTRKERADDAMLVLEKISREVREAKEVTVPIDNTSSNTSTLTFEKKISSPSQHVKYMLDSSTKKIMRYSASSASGLSSAIGNVVAENVNYLSSANPGFIVTKVAGGGSNDIIVLSLDFIKGSEWETKVYPRNYGL